MFLNIKKWHFFKLSNLAEILTDVFLVFCILLSPKMFLKCIIINVLNWKNMTKYWVHLTFLVKSKKKKPLWQMNFYFFVGILCAMYITVLHNLCFEFFWRSDIRIITQVLHLCFSGNECHFKLTQSALELWLKRGTDTFCGCFSFLKFWTGLRDTNDSRRN